MCKTPDMPSCIAIHHLGRAFTWILASHMDPWCSILSYAVGLAMQMFTYCGEPVCAGYGHVTPSLLMQMFMSWDGPPYSTVH